ncbi:MAG: group II intron reverse transcriptase/maturase, partial [Clostridiales bacterium]|nr:group II intron reverse transcriptase/maturase [Clostridiales bacterium]
ILVVIWKQWKKIRTRYDALRKLGANHKNAFNAANCRKGYRYVCGTATIHAALSDERLKKRGLTSLIDHFNKVHLITN